MTEAFYPMPLFVSLNVRDVAASAQWYADALGFRSVYAMPTAEGDQAMNHIRLGKYQDLMLMAGSPSETGPVSAASRPSTAASASVNTSPWRATLPLSTAVSP